MTITLPPLIAPVADLDQDSLNRYARHTRIPGLGHEGQRRLRGARVLIIGAGGLGSPIALYLAAAGIGALGIVDDDDVELSNLQRQILHRSADVGRPKVTSAARAIGDLDPGIDVQAIAERFTERSAARLLRGWDLVIDGSDNFTTRYLVDDACALAGIPHVWGSILQFEGQFSVFWHNPPVGPGIDYRDLYPSPPPTGFAPSCAEAGVLGALCGVVGSFMALEAIKLIAGAGPVALGSLHLVDALEGTTSTLSIAPRTDRSPITTLQPVREVCMSGVSEIDPAALVPLLKSPDTVLVDVRENEEHQAILIPGSLHIPLEALLNSLADSTGSAADPQLTDASRLIVYCAAGARSQRAAQAFARAGMAASSLAGGIERWHREGHPITSLTTTAKEPA